MSRNKIIIIIIIILVIAVLFYSLQDEEYTTWLDGTTISDHTYPPTCKDAERSTVYRDIMEKDPKTWTDAERNIIVYNLDAAHWKIGTRHGEQSNAT